MLVVIKDQMNETRREIQKTVRRENKGITLEIICERGRVKEREIYESKREEDI